MKIENIDTNVCRMLSQEIEKAVKPVAEKYGLEIKVASGSYHSLEFRPKVVVSVISETGIPVGFPSTARLIGLPEDCYGKTFRQGSRQFKITGIELRRPKMPVSAQDVLTGKGFKFSVNSILRGLGLPATSEHAFY